MKRILILLLIFDIYFYLSTKSSRSMIERYVVMDAVCGLDDFRAINLMLASANIRILAIITCKRLLNAWSGSIKVEGCLK